jgi:hypothetical protein
VHPVFRTVRTQLFDPETIILMRAFDRHAEFLCENARLAAVVKMAVGEQNLFNRHTVVECGDAQFFKIAARIGEGTPHGGRNNRGFHRGICHAIDMATGDERRKGEA